MKIMQSKQLAQANEQVHQDKKMALHGDGDGDADGGGSDGPNLINKRVEVVVW